MNNLNETTGNWSKDEFLAFLMLHIGNADLNLSSEELIVIAKIVNEEQFAQIQWVWSKCNDIECINIIKSLRRKLFAGDEGKEKLLEEMKALAMSDANFSTNEEIMIRSLKKLI